MRHPLELCIALALIALSVAAGAVELRDATLAAGGSPVLQSGSGDVRLEDGRLGTPAVPLPEPGTAAQLLGGAVTLGWLVRRRRPSPPRREAPR